jgi:hypothetical protein
MPATITGRNSTARYGAMRGPTAACGSDQNDGQRASLWSYRRLKTLRKDLRQRPHRYNVPKSSGTSPNFLITLASLKSPVVVAAQQRNFCSCIGTAHFHLRQPRRVLSFAHRGWGKFLNEPASRGAPMPAAFSMAVSYARCSLANSVAALAGRVGARWDATL